MTGQEKWNEYNATHFDKYDEDCAVEFTYEKEAFEDWLMKSESNCGKKRTIRGANAIKERAYYYFSFMETLSKENVRLYIESAQDNGLEPTTINGRLMALRTYITFLSKKYRAPHLLEFPIKTIKVQKKQFIENVISRADYEFLISEAKKNYEQPNVYLGCKIMGTTGLRRMELYQVKVEHIKHGYVDVIGKGGKQRRIYFPKKAREEILEYLSALGVDSGYVIRRWKTNTDSQYYTANTREGGKYNEIKKFDRLFAYQLERAGQKFGIAPELMHAHGFRHFFAKEFLKHRLDISLLADLLGHSSLEITRIYLKMTSREQAEVVDEVVDW